MMLTINGDVGLWRIYNNLEFPSTFFLFKVMEHTFLHFITK
jgi:hypothetical protein